MRLVLIMGGMALLAGCAAQDDQTRLRGQFDLAVADRQRAQGDYAGAAVYYQAAEAEDPVRAAVGEGECFLGLQKLPDAEREFREGLSHDSDCVACLGGLGAALLAQRRAAEAVDPLRQALVAGGTARDARALVIALALTDRRGEAIALARKHPDDNGMIQDMALVLALDGQFDAAIAAMKQVVARAPNDRRAKANLALVYGLAGQSSDTYAARLRAMNVTARTQALFNASP